MASSRHNGENAHSPSTAAGSAGAGQDPAGEFLTTAQGLRLPDTDHSLKAGERGPTLLEDFHLREKITHFDHERIPERVVHARGAAAHGVFESYGTGRSVTKAGFLAGKAFLAYRRRGGDRRFPVPDFYIGAHAAVRGYRLLTRDAARYRTYFPSVEVIAPAPG